MRCFRQTGWFWQALENIASIQPPDTLTLPPFEVLCDVDNPLCGDRGVVAVFGPQKGADPSMVRELDKGLCHLAAIMAGS